MKITEYMANRHAEAVSRREERRAAEAAARATAAELEEARTELAETIAAARDNLISPPEQGAPWNAETRYTAGDTVEGGYIALRYNRNKNPADYLGVYWEHDAAEIVAWDSIEDGTVIYEGGIVSYGGKNWICTAQHIKSTVYKPKAGSSKWSEYTE